MHSLFPCSTAWQYLKSRKYWHISVSNHCLPDAEESCQPCFWHWYWHEGVPKTRCNLHGYSWPPAQSKVHSLYSFAVFIPSQKIWKKPRPFLPGAKLSGHSHQPCSGQRPGRPALQCTSWTHFEKRYMQESHHYLTPGSREHRYFKSLPINLAWDQREGKPCCTWVTQEHSTS